MDTDDTFSSSTAPAGNFCAAHKILGPMCKFLDGEIDLSTDELSQYLRVIRDHFDSTDSDDPSEPLDPGGVSGVFMHALKVLRSDPCMTLLDGSEQQNQSIIEPYLEAEKAVSLIYTKTSPHPEHPARAILDHHRYHWHDCNDYHRALRIRSVTNFSSCYAHVRNEFMKFSDLVVETLEIRLQVDEADDAPLRTLLTELVTLWYTLLRDRTDRDKQYLQDSLCFRCDRIMHLMSQLNMDTACRTATQVWINALLLLPSYDAPERNRLHNKDHLLIADRYQHDQYTKSKNKRRHREFMAYVRKSVRPVLQGTAQRNSRSLFAGAMSPDARLESGEEHTKVQLINVNKEKTSDVKLLVCSTPDLSLQPQDSFKLLIEDIGNNQPVRNEPMVCVHAKIIRRCDDSEQLPKKGLLLVVELDSIWSNNPHWLALVDNLNPEAAYENRLH